jgi:hypothetical protein
MAYEHKDMTGAMFRNNKNGNEKRPDYRGNAMIAGVLYETASWVKEGKNGKFLSTVYSIPKPKSDAPSPANSSLAPWEESKPVQDSDTLPF